MHRLLLFTFSAYNSTVPSGNWSLFCHTEATSLILRSFSTARRHSLSLPQSNNLRNGGLLASDKHNPDQNQANLIHDYNAAQNSPNTFSGYGWRAPPRLSNRYQRDVEWAARGGPQRNMHHSAPKITQRRATQAQSWNNNTTKHKTARRRRGL